jgi:hypothetical protein
MCQLIFILALWLTVFQPEKDSLFIIVDDCGNWEEWESPFNESLQKSSTGRRFSLGKKDDSPFFFLKHFWIEENERLEELTLSCPKILAKNPLYSSELTWEDWYKLRSANKKIYFLLPSAYCSAKRFDWNTKFTIYEMYNDLILPDD